MDKKEFTDKTIEELNKLEHDREAQHCHSDDIMEELLIEIGYERLIKYIRSTNRWYA